MRLGLALAICLLGAAAVLQATAIVVFRTDTRIVLAADSRTTTRDAYGKERPGTVCKVQPAGRWFTTLGGYMGIGEGAAFSLHPRLIRAIAKARTMAEVEQALRTTVFPQLQSDLARGSTEPAFAIFQQGNLISQIIVAGTNVGDPTLRVGVLMTFLTRISPLALETAWIECPGPRCGDGKLFLSASQEGPLRSLLKRPRPEWVERADADGARRLIVAQIAAPSSQASAPIDLLEITGAGARWIQRDPQSRCPAALASPR